MADSRPTAGVIGLGDMGSGLARNLLAAGFPTVGFDLDATRLQRFVGAGGVAARSAREVAEKAEAVFVMVLNGDQARSVLLGAEGVAAGMRAGGSVIMTATIKPSEVRQLAADLGTRDLHLVDSPVTGGYAGAQNGTLTLMAAATAERLAAVRPFLEAVSNKVFHVGDKPGDGQVMKACLQALIGSVYTATFEAAVLAAKSGIPGQVLYDVFTNSAASSVVTNNGLKKILDRAFVGTGSHIATMYKDLTISLDHARDTGVPLFTAAAAMQLFQAGKTRFPDEDNWCVTKVLEEIVDAQVTWPRPEP